jgi:hypothetical protein
MGDRCTIEPRFPVAAGMAQAGARRSGPTRPSNAAAARPACPSRCSAARCAASLPPPGPPHQPGIRRRPWCACRRRTAHGHDAQRNGPALAMLAGESWRAATPEFFVAARPDELAIPLDTRPRDLGAKTRCSPDHEPGTRRGRNVLIPEGQVKGALQIETGRCAIVAAPLPPVIAPPAGPARSGGPRRVSAPGRRSTAAKR